MSCTCACRWTRPNSWDITKILQDKPPSSQRVWPLSVPLSRLVAAELLRLTAVGAQHHDPPPYGMWGQCPCSSRPPTWAAPSPSLLTLELGICAMWGPQMALPLDPHPKVAQVVAEAPVSGQGAVMPLPGLS